MKEKLKRNLKKPIDWDKVIVISLGSGLAVILGVLIFGPKVEPIELWYFDNED